MTWILNDLVVALDFIQLYLRLQWLPWFCVFVWFARLVKASHNDAIDWTVPLTNGMPCTVVTANQHITL